ncbi:hypothetical protein ACROYT_G033262 [Oculina patagonica]
MAEGGGYFGHVDPELDKLLDHDDNDDNDEEQEVNTTKKFDPPDASTPYTPYHGGEEIQMQTMQHEKSGQPSYIEKITFNTVVSEEDKQSMIKSTKQFIKDKFSEVVFKKIGPIGFGKRPENDGKIVSFGSRGGDDEIFKKDGTGLLKKFTDKYKVALGPPAEDVIAQDNEEIRETRQSLREAEIQLQQAERIDTQKEKAAQEVRDLRIRIERAQAKIDQLGSNVENKTQLREQRQVLKNYETDFENAKKEVAALEKQAKQKAKEQTRVDQLRASLAVKESEKTLCKKGSTRQEQKQAAEERVAERTEELARLQTQIAEREMSLPLRERIKEIFKKNGVTVTAIFAAGVTIGAVIGAITNSLKATGKALGKGLSDVGSKVASALPGLIGSIVSFLFKTAGQAIGFLAEHTWLLILAAVAFLVERYLKKRR